MTTTPSPAPSPSPGGKKPWRKSEAPGHKPKHAPEKRPGAVETVKKVLKATREAVGTVLSATVDVTGKAIRSTRDAVGKAAELDVGNIIKKAFGVGSKALKTVKSKPRKSLRVVGAALALAGGTALYAKGQIEENARQAAAAEKASAVPRDSIVIPVTIQAEDGKIKITPKDVETDACGQEHALTIDPIDGEVMRKGRMEAAQSTVRFTVEAHDETHIYEADEAVTADEELRDATISAHLADGETEK